MQYEFDLFNGLLGRLHRLHVQFCLESQSEETGIMYPRIQEHKIKDGHGKVCFQSVKSVTDKEIAKAIEESKEGAKKMIKDLYIFICLNTSQQRLLGEPTNSSFRRRYDI